MISSPYFFKKYWQRYHKRLPEKYGGESGIEISPVTLWRQHFFGELLPRAWNVLMRDIMPPDLWIELEAFTRYWERRRFAYLRKGGFLTTTSGKPRELFTPTGKPRKLGERPDTKQYDDCIEVTRAKYERMAYGLRPPSRLVNAIGTLLTKVGVLQERHREKVLMPEEVTVLALSGVITGQIGGRAEIRWRRSKMYKRGADTNKYSKKLKTKHLLTGRRSLRERYDHFLNNVYGLASRYGRLPPLLDG